MKVGETYTVWDTARYRQGKIVQLEVTIKSVDGVAYGVTKRGRWVSVDSSGASAYTSRDKAVEVAIKLARYDVAEATKALQKHKDVLRALYAL